LTLFVPAVGIALIAAGSATAVAEVADRNQRERDVPDKRAGLAQKVTSAEKVALAEKAKLEEAVAKLRAASWNLKFEIPNINGAFVDLSGSMATLHFRSLSDIQRAIGFIEAWDWLCKAVRQPTANGANISTVSYEFVLEKNERCKRLLRLSSRLGTTPLPEAMYGC